MKRWIQVGDARIGRECRDQYEYMATRKYDDVRDYLASSDSVDLYKRQRISADYL